MLRGLRAALGEVRRTLRSLISRMAQRAATAWRLAPEPQGTSIDGSDDGHRDASPVIEPTVVPAEPALKTEKATRRLYRFAKRRAAWESGNPTEIREVEFKSRDGGADLRPSVYQVDDPELVRTYAEHAAAAPLRDPPTTTRCLDLEGTSDEISDEPGNSWFRFSRERHREIVFSGTDALEEMIRIVVRDAARHRDVKKADILQYARDRFAEKDVEWQALKESDRAPSWVKKASGE